MTLSEYIKSHGFKSVKEFLGYVDGLSHQNLTNWYNNPVRHRWLDLMITGVKTEKFIKSQNNLK